MATGIGGRPWDWGVDPVKSRPVEVNFGSFRSDTFALQQAGWKLSYDKLQDMTSYRPRHMLAMEHTGYNIRGLAEAFGENVEMYGSFRGEHLTQPLVFNVTAMGRDVVMMQHTSPIDFSNFKPIDATPTMRGPFQQKMSDFDIFAYVEKAPELIIPEENVDQLLQRILDLQQPDREKRIIEAVRNEYGENTSPAKKNYGNIISLVA